MNILKRIVGVLGLLLGSLGLTLCLAVIIGGWWINSPLTDSLLRVFPPVENVLALLDDGVQTADDVLVTAQTKVEQGGEQVMEIAVEINERVEPVLPIVDVASKTALAATGVAYVASIGSPEERLSGTFARLLGRTDLALNSAEQLSQRIIDGDNQATNAISNELTDLRGVVADVDSELAQVEEQVATTKQRLPWWIDLGSLLITFVFLWFGIAQYCLVRNSWQWVRGK